MPTANTVNAKPQRYLAQRLSVLSLLLLALLLSHDYSFSLFHTLAEMFTVLVSLIMAVVAWHSFSFTRNHYLLLLGSGYFWVGLLDMTHTFTYPGVGIINPPSVDTTFQIWIITRALEALTLLAAVLYLQKQIPTWRLNLALGLFTLITTVVVFRGYFPAMYEVGTGFTITKVYAEYATIAVLLLALALTWRLRALLDQTLLLKMLAAIAFTIAAESTFTTQDTLHASHNMLGHVLKFVSFWLVFDALIRASLTSPYSLMSAEANSFHAIPNPVLLLDRQGIIQTANPAACQMTDLPAHKMIGKSCHELFHPQDIPSLQCPVCQHIRSGEELRGYEMSYGNNTWHELMLTPINVGAGGVIHVSYDITLRRQLLNSVRQNEQKYRNLVENLRGELFFYARDPEGHYHYVSPSIERVLGYEPNIFLEQAAELLAPLTQRPTNSKNKGFELEVEDVQGKLHQLEVSETPVFDTNGVQAGVEGIAYDISRHIEMDRHLRAINDQLTQSQQRLALHVQRTPLAVIEFDDQFRITQWNQAAEKIFGYKREEILLKHGSMLAPNDDHQRVQTAWEELIQQQRGFQSTRQNMAKDGRVITCEWYNSVLTDENDKVTGVASLVNDITQRELAEARLNYQANYDTLTQLPNRLLAFDRMAQAIENAQRHGYAMAVLFVDLDMFKHVNDTLGHTVGDDLLVEVAERLASSVRAEDTVARLGGDEFLIILQELDEVRQAKIVVRKILSSLRPTFHLGDLKLHIAASIGITGYPDDGADPHTLLSNADAAMYKAKEKGRNTYAFFDKKMGELANRRLTLESHLRQAIAKNELELHYQPQICLNQQRIVGAEALLRWHSEELGQIFPDEFIPLAEDTGLIHDIGQWVLERACMDAADWQSLSNEPIRVSVNFSPRQLHDERCIQNLERALYQSKLPSHLLEMEITESLLLEHIQGTLNLLYQIKHMGIRLSLDDFGTGYSSLSYLKRFPFDVLKIDKAFVMDVLHDKDDAALCEAIIAMAKILDLEVVGEGTETLEHVTFLQQRGANIAQGYYLARPMPLAHFRDYITQFKPDKGF